MSSSVRASGFENSAIAWDRLINSCFTNELFVTRSWQQLWFSHFGHGSDLQILTICENDVVLGMAPLMNKNGVLSFIGGTDLCDYADFLVPPSNAHQFYTNLFEYIRALAWHTIDLRSIPQDSPTLEWIPNLAACSGYTCTVVEEDAAPKATLAPTWDMFISTLSKKSRHELRRKLRRIETEGSATHQTYSNPKSVQENIHDFFRLHRASSRDKSEFMTAEREAFFSDMSVEFAGNDELILSFLKIGGVRAASCLVFNYRDTHLLYNSGYDPSYSKLSVGLINKAFAIKDAILAGKRHFDFLRGTERYKYELGGENTSVFSLTVRRQ